MPDNIIQQNLEEPSPCSMCERLVSQEDLAIKCDICDTWCHIECASITEEKYTTLMEEDSFEWTCPLHNILEVNKSVNETLVVFIPRAKVNSEECIKAKEEELAKLVEYKVYDEVSFTGQSTISTKS